MVLEDGTDHLITTAARGRDGSGEGMVLEVGCGRLVRWRARSGRGRRNGVGRIVTAARRGSSTDRRDGSGEGMVLEGELAEECRYKRGGRGWIWERMVLEVMEPHG